MLWLVTATIGDVPIAILACAGLLLGVWVMARGTRSDAGAAAAGMDEPPAPAAAARAPSPVAPEAPQPTTFRQGTIRLGGETPPATDSEPESQGAPSQPAAPPLPEVPPHGFRQGRIRVGGLERGWKRDD